MQALVEDPHNGMGSLDRSACDYMIWAYEGGFSDNVLEDVSFLSDMAPTLQADLSAGVRLPMEVSDSQK